MSAGGTDGRTDGRADRPHGSTLTCANSRESILNDTYGIHRVDFPLMQIACGLQMKDSQINKSRGGEQSRAPLSARCDHNGMHAGMRGGTEAHFASGNASPQSFARKVFFPPGEIKGVTGDQK